MSDDSGTIVASGTSGSMPTGSGSERLRRVTVTALNNGWQNNVISGTAGHIYTILSIIFQDQQGASGTALIRVNNGSTDIVLVGSSNVVPANGTFVFSDRFVMEEDDDLDVYNACTNGDWYISFIDQDWT